MKKACELFELELDGIYKSSTKNFHNNKVVYTDIPCKVLGKRGERYLIRILEPTARKMAGDELLVLRKSVQLVRDLTAYKKKIV